MGRILLVRPPFSDLYSGSMVESSVPAAMPLNLATLATPLVESGHEVRILDLKAHEKPLYELESVLEDFKPLHIGLTSTTPTFPQVEKIIDRTKKVLDSSTVVCGGPHVTTRPEEGLEAGADYVVKGEGDFAMKQIVEEGPEDVPGIYYREGGTPVSNEREFIRDLDRLPVPALDLVDFSDYRQPRTIARKNPVAGMETSRGCPFSCAYCNKKVFGRNFRYKSVERVIEEVKEYVDHGIEEIKIYDDGFTTDRKRAIEICKRLIEEDLPVKFNAANGIRADSVDPELMNKMAEAGFYRVAFGVESGNQEILDRINKGESLEEIRNAFKIAKEAGLETSGYFIIGLPGETGSTIKETINFAKELNPYIAKFNIATPLPGTELFRELQSEGNILDEKWENYGFHENGRAWRHENLSQKELEKWYKRSYREFYLRPTYILRREIKSLLNGNIFSDMKAFLKTGWV